MMYLQIVRRNPRSDWNPYVYDHWIVGSLTKKQRRFLAKFSHRTRKVVWQETTAKWGIIGPSLVLVAMMLNAATLQAQALREWPLFAGVIIAAGCGYILDLRRKFRTWRYANACIKDRRFVVSERDASWSRVTYAAKMVLSRLNDDEVFAVTSYFQGATECDILMRDPKLSWNDQHRIHTHLDMTAKKLEEELEYFANLRKVIPTAHAEYADHATIVAKALEEEQALQLHERVNLALDQPR